MIHVCLFVSLILSMATFKTSNGKRKSSLLVGFCVLFVVAALRNEYGNDFNSYESIFRNAHLGLNSTNVELVFFELNKLFPSFHFLLATLSLIYLVVAYQLIVHNVPPKNQKLSMFIFVINPYLFLMSLSSIRQTLALCIFIIALNLRCKKKITNLSIYILLILVATFIHQTACLLIPVYFYFNLCKTKKIVHFERLVFVITPIVLIGFSGLLNNLISYVLSYFSNNLNYLYYITENEPNSLRATLLTLFFYVYILINLDKVDGKAYQYSRLYLCGLLFAILSYRYSMFTRFQMYFDLFGIVSLPAVFQACKQKTTRVERMINVYLFPALITVIFMLRYYSFFTNPMWEYFFEYSTFI